MLYTTFNLLREHEACEHGYRTLAKHLGGVTHYGQDKPIALTVVLDSNGVDDALWCLRATTEPCDTFARLLAVAYARRVQHLMTDPRSIAALDVAERYANGRATDAELSAARVAAQDAARAAEYAAQAAAWVAADAARNAAHDAAYAAADAAGAVATDTAAQDAAWAAERAAQTDMLRAALEAHGSER